MGYVFPIQDDTDNKLLFKPCFEKYLINIPYNLRIRITILGTSNLKIPIDTGRWPNIPVEECICHICKANIGDEFRYLFICKSPEQ